MKAVVCFSGGIDSTLALAMYSRICTCHALLFDYGQPHRIELDRAVEILQHYQIPYSIKKLTFMDRKEGVVFPGRNLLFAAEAVIFAASNGFDTVVFGCNQSDWLNFPDCRPAFWDNFRKSVAAAYSISVATPLLHLSKAEIVVAAKRLSVPIEKTWSCYTPKNDEQCGECLACKTRINAGA